MRRAPQDIAGRYWLTWCDTSGMTNPVPSHPRPLDPEKWNTWMDADGKLYVFNGIDWELYNSPPKPPNDGDPDPTGVTRELPP
jgi:hypothetical protein